MSTVENALIALAADPGTTRGFRATDATFGHSLAGRVRQGTPLSDKQRRGAWRMLAGYADVLTDLGIDYAALPEPAAVPVGPAKTGGVKLGALVRATGGETRIFTVSPFEDAAAMKTVPGGKFHKATTCKSCMANGGQGNGKCEFPGTGWHYPASPSTAAALVEVFDTIQTSRGITWRSDEGFGRLLAQSRDAIKAQEFRNADDLPAVPGLKTSAWLHQRQAYWFARALDAVLLDMEMGTGKSLVAVALFVERIARAAKEGTRFMGLIVCPERVVGVWDKQFRIHSGIDVHVVDGRRENRRGAWVFRPIKDRVAEFEDALYECACGRPHVVVVNYGALPHEPIKSWGKAQKWDAVAFDEIHKIKNPTGSWSKWCNDVGAVAAFRMGLTGTLMPHTPLDVFGPIRALDRGVFGTTLTKFRARYAVMGGFNNHEVVDMQNEDELATRVSSLTYRVGAEVLDLPAEVPDVTLECVLSPAASKVYDEVEGEMFAALEVAMPDEEAGFSDSITAQNVLTKMLRLQQITGGSVKTDSGETLNIDHAKEDLLADVLSDIDGEKPVVVFCRFRSDLDAVERVATALGRTYGELSGRRDDALTRDATLAPGIAVAGVQLQAGGTGIDLTSSHYAVYFSMGYSLGDYLQSRKRLARPGQVNSVRFIHLVASGTIDLEVYKALAARQEVADYVGAMIRARQEGREPVVRTARTEASRSLDAALDTFGGTL